MPGYATLVMQFPCPQDEPPAVECARINMQRKRVASGSGPADSIILATTRRYSGKVLAGDPYFRGIAEVELP